MLVFILCAERPHHVPDAIILTNKASFCTALRQRVPTHCKLRAVTLCFVCHDMSER
jgi:hypothetical protein